jgi:hypothetical protein
LAFAAGFDASAATAGVGAEVVVAPLETVGVDAVVGAAIVVVEDAEVVVVAAAAKVVGSGDEVICEVCFKP